MARGDILPARIGRIGAVAVAFALIGAAKASAVTPGDLYRRGQFPARVGQSETFWNPSGRLGTFLATGAVATAGHAFFQPLGTNGRSCATCHQPPSALGLSLRNIRSRYLATEGKDPLFAAIDGANCPTAVTSPSPSSGGAGSRHPGKRAFSLLVNRGTIRMSLPWPPRNADGSAKPVEFTLEIRPGDDAPGCNLDPTWGLPSGRVSVYRRPPSVAQMNFKTLRPSGSGPILAGSLMWDGRKPSLERQAIDATRDHAEATRDPTSQQIAQIVEFQSKFFAAQLIDGLAGRLDAADGRGGPAQLQRRVPGLAFGTTFDEYARWLGRTDALGAIARGQQIFNSRTFTAAAVDGFNDRPAVGNPNPSTTCSSCHNIASSGADFVASPQLNVGAGGSAVSSGGPAAATVLPRFTLTCLPSAKPGFHGRGPLVVNDPGLALVTGKCADIGKFTVPQLRGLAAREPYFHDGSARDLPAVVDFYEQRFALGLSAQEKRDLAAFLAAL